ncbi:MAG: CAAD domain-containing protein [cyanobacterium endosymbiont of Rhopalodia musculus]|uniref:CAAD domain-containing protein n=1 Tax=cyanobacterium endosymbiont of Epithemia clementina EcSB TaxID=3034674 RepID=UPI002480045F|nr:CAAD domain-containing protein [cyanobacterium endosymbiont of Epithemia clementina EcSB]WGT68464.1 CAAD domain-containing protein [cyanobacterium endosymbiont of Epithemia clementina EcSB]
MEFQTQEKTIPEGLDTEVPGTLTQQPPMTDQPWQEWLEPVVDLLSNASDYIGRWFNSYKQLLTTLGIVILAIISVRIIVAVLGAISDVPLLAPVLQLVGLTHAAWFAWRYLWKASNRQELMAEFDALRNQIFGENA